MLENVAREGARAGVPSSAVNSDVTTAVTNALNSAHFPANSVTTTITNASGTTINVATVSVGGDIKVTVSATWGTIVPAIAR